MAKHVYLTIDDDVSAAARKIKRESAASLLLVVPKGASIFISLKNIQKFKQIIDLSGKSIAIVTNDQKIQRIAAENGFELRGLDALRSSGVQMDVTKKQIHPAYPTPQSFSEREKNILEQESRRQEAAVPQPLLTPLPIPDYQTAAVTEMPQLFPESRKFVIPEKLPKKKKKERNIAATFFKTMLVLAVLFLVALVVFILPEADITVYARVQPISRNYLVTVDKSAQTVNTDQFIIPGQLINQDETVTKTYPATGQLNVGLRAQGTVQIYNFTKQTYKLGAATTILTVGSNTYHFASDVADIRPTRYLPNSGEVDSTSLSAPVAITADQAGESSNLPGGTQLTIHNTILGSMPQLLYAKNTDAIDGGTSRFRAVVAASDLAKAKADLQTQANTDLRQQLGNADDTIPQSGFSAAIKNISFNQAAGDQVNAFNGLLSAHVTALAFHQSDLRSMLESRVNITLDADKYLVTTSGEEITDDYKTVDFTQGTGVLNVSFAAFSTAKIDSAGIASEINGKNPDAIKELLLSDPNIDGVDIAFKPFWVKSVPKFSGKVYVHVKLDSASS